MKLYKYKEETLDITVIFVAASPFIARNILQEWVRIQHGDNELELKDGLEIEVFSLDSSKVIIEF